MSLDGITYANKSLILKNPALLQKRRREENTAILCFTFGNAGFLFYGLQSVNRWMLNVFTHNSLNCNYHVTYVLGKTDKLYVLGELKG